MHILYTLYNPTVEKAGKRKEGKERERGRKVRKLLGHHDYKITHLLRYRFKFEPQSYLPLKPAVCFPVWGSVIFSSPGDHTWSASEPSL